MVLRGEKQSITGACSLLGIIVQPYRVRPPRNVQRLLDNRKIKRIVVTSLMAHLGHRLEGILLFGSRALHENNYKFQDVDILILVNRIDQAALASIDSCVQDWFAEPLDVGLYFNHPPVVVADGSCGGVNALLARIILARHLKWYNSAAMGEWLALLHNWANEDRLMQAAEVLASEALMQMGLLVLSFREELEESRRAGYFLFNFSRWMQAALYKLHKEIVVSRRSCLRRAKLLLPHEIAIGGQDPIARIREMTCSNFGRQQIYLSCMEKHDRIWLS